MEDNSITMFLMECMTQALVELLKEKPLSAISVAEVTRKAGVSRMTFYRNYNSIEDIFDKYLDHLFRRYHEEVLQHNRHATFIQKENILLCFEFFRQYSDFVQCLMTNRLESCLREKFIESELDLSLTSRNDIKSRYVTVAYANALFGVLTEWVQRDMKDDPNELAGFICDLFQERIRRY